MSLYKQYKTDEVLETAGVVLDYGDARITIARAGGANKRFAKVLEAKAKPYRRAMQTETMDAGKAEELMRDAYAEAVVLNWETATGEDEKGEKIWKKGIEPDTGDKLLPVTAKNISQTFKNLPDLFADVQTQANRVSIFREDILEIEAGN